MSCRCLCSTCINRRQWKYHDSFLLCVLSLEAFAFHHGVVAFVRFVQNSENTDESSHVTDDIFALPVRRPTTASRFVLSMCTSTRIDVHENDYEYDDLCLSICTHCFVVNAFSSSFNSLQSDCYIKKCTVFFNKYDQHFVPDVHNIIRHPNRIGENRDFFR